MFGFGKKKTTDVQHAESPKLWSRLSQSLSKTRHRLTTGISDLFTTPKPIDDELLRNLETQLIMADVGIDATRDLMTTLKQTIKRQKINDSNELIAALKHIMTKQLIKSEKSLVTETEQKPFTVLMIGVNGAGKTTTVGKCAHYFQQKGHSLMLAAADTFRAAAIDQLQTWGERNNVPVIAQHPGADSAAVGFDALQSAQAKKTDILIIDTAGRLHTQQHLMEELKKMKRVLQKLDATAPHEILLVLDASIGQNTLQQAKIFHEALGVTGLCITKLDGSAKGGSIFAIVNTLKLPIRFIGVGEHIDDLEPFVASTFVDALFGETVSHHELEHSD